MSLMKEISDAALSFRMCVSGFVLAGAVVGTAAGFLSSSHWVGMGLGVVAGGITAWALSKLPMSYS